MRCAKSKVSSATIWPWPRKSRSSNGNCRNRLAPTMGRKASSALSDGAFVLCEGLWTPGDMPWAAKPALAKNALFRHLCSPASHSATAGLPLRLDQFCFRRRRSGFLMKVTVERAELLKSLGHVHRVVERRNTIPILANVLVKADRGKLSLKATDLDLEVTDSTAAEVSPGGSTTVPAHMFYEIVRKLPEGAQIVIEGSGDRAVLSLRAGRSRFTLQTLPESDFPDRSEE